MKYKTIRTEKKHYDYFEDKWNTFFKSLNCFGYVGHVHEISVYKYFKTIDSAGYKGYFEYINDNEGKILIVSDLHLGMYETKDNFTRDIFPELTSNKYNKVIFLGDTFDMALCSDEEILNVSRFWNWLSKTDKEVIFIVGNHDINLLNTKDKLFKKISGIRKEIIRLNPNAKIVRIYQIKSMCFAHGDMFDPFVQVFGKLYLISFKIIDYTGSFGNYLWSKISKYF